MAKRVVLLSSILLIPFLLCAAKRKETITKLGPVSVSGTALQTHYGRTEALLIAAMKGVTVRETGYLTLETTNKILTCSLPWRELAGISVGDEVTIDGSLVHVAGQYDRFEVQHCKVTERHSTPKSKGRVISGNLVSKTDSPRGDFVVLELKGDDQKVYSCMTTMNNLERPNYHSGDSLSVVGGQSLTDYYMDSFKGTIESCQVLSHTSK